MDNIKEKIEEIVGKLKNSEELAKQFKEEPVKAVEKILGVDLPDELIEKIVEGVKAKMTADDVKDVFGAIKKLF